MTKPQSVLFFAVYPLIAAWVSFALDVNALFSTIVFYGIPAIYLSFLKPGFIKKALYFSLLSIPAIVIVDYIAEITGTWLWPIPDSIFPKLFGYVSVEVIIWAYLHFYIAVMFYEYFFDKRKRSKIVYARSKELLAFSLLFFATFLLIMAFSKSSLLVPYWYAVFSFIFIVPPVILEEYN
ncbi:MAG: hypothetical protein HY545_02845, partial [Candidatus Doudnabacteria bacterium]|nr:hypothetical protein [Candidatus Doudnabacteria bacterium]